jgi:hypothetical protein
MKKIKNIYLYICILVTLFRIKIKKPYLRFSQTILNLDTPDCRLYYKSDEYVLDQLKKIYLKD